jgi:hypothetical protein
MSGAAYHTTWVAPLVAATVNTPPADVENAIFAVVDGELVQTMVTGSE